MSQRTKTDGTSYMLQSLKKEIQLYFRYSFIDDFFLFDSDL